jgi:hypothetical protein
MRALELTIHRHHIPYVSLSCFYDVWQRDYGNIKVSKPSEDICNKCAAFANRHKATSANSSADQYLFLNDIPDLTDMDSESEAEDDDPDNKEPEGSPRLNPHINLRRSPRLRNC